MPEDTVVSQLSVTSPAMTPETRELFVKYISKQCSIEEREAVRAYLRESHDHLNELMQTIREEALRRMGHNPEDDFLLKRLKDINPKVYGESVFGREDTECSALYDNSFEDLYSILCKELLDD